MRLSFGVGLVSSTLAGAIDLISDEWVRRTMPTEEVGV